MFQFLLNGSWLSKGFRRKLLTKGLPCQKGRLIDCLAVWPFRLYICIYNYRTFIICFERHHIWPTQAIVTSMRYPMMPCCWVRGGLGSQHFNASSPWGALLPASIAGRARSLAPFPCELSADHWLSIRVVSNQPVLESTKVCSYSSLLFIQ